MAPISVFDIHLLLDSICRDLTTLDVRRCTLVCRDWNASFGPYLWQTIVIRRRSTYNRFNSSTLIARLAQHSKTIHSLDSDFPEVWPVFLTVPLDNLTVLKSPSLPTRISQSYISVRRRQEQQLLPAIRGLQHLRELHIHIENSDPIDSKHVRQWLLSSCRLEKLHIRLRLGVYRLAKTSEEDAADILELNGTIVESASITDLSFPCNLRYRDGYTLLPLLRLCSKLERIALPKLHVGGARTVAAILKATATRLRHLDLHAGASNVVLIRAITSLETFICSRRPQESQLVVDALLEHRHTLRELVFERTDMGGTTGVMLLSLLKDCPNLESFSALSAPVRGKNAIRYVYQDPAVRASDFEASGGSDIPWTCERLKVLKLQFASRVDITPDQLKPDGKVPHYLDKVVRHVLEVVPPTLIAQIGWLTQLEELRLGRAQTTLFDPEVIQPPFTHGSEDAGIDERQRQLEMQHRENVSKLLRVLSTLKNLKRLELRGLKEFIDMSELKEARKLWKQIEWVAYS
ncbi:hypothetical protein BG005_008000 [Podila minutissima]|nr:hypothetical protein BG005_008000 [Podila minutissima]